MRNLLLVAHGSRREASNDEVRDLTNQLQSHIDSYERPPFEKIGCAFLELASPSIPEGLEDYVSEGAKDITVLPYFLSAGRHVSEDIPAEVEKVRDKYPEINIKIADYLGSSTGICDLLLSLAMK
jgi:sirohydrochlorin ferrochelatase